ncbi:MAG: FAD:protein FMN transferase [Gammaproteobacteria bacterium]|nr:FAD:protein FMN transferase [Gammaproteobacteria bacterium]
MRPPLPKLLLVTLFALSGCSDGGRSLEYFAGAAMGTTWSVQIIDLPAGVTHESLNRQIADEIEKTNRAMSTYRDDSDVVRFNRAMTIDWFPVERSVTDVVAEALTVSEKSDGAFDITINPVVELWGFGSTGPRDDRPSTTEIDAIRALVGHRYLEMRTDPPALRKKLAALSIDLSAIAKGYAVDQVAALLDNHGSTDYLIEIGGELRGRGHNDRGDAWRIAVERPDPGLREVQELIELRDSALATSGDYRNFFVQNGRRYSHTIDPRTAVPVEHSLASVTVLADTAMRADALATALLVLGPKAGAELAIRENLAVMFIARTKNGFDITNSPAMQCYLEHTACE